MSRTYFFWDPLSDNILQERDESGTVTAEYTTEPGLYGNLISQNRGGVESQYHFDPQGSTLALTDDNQQVTDTYSYSAFGEVTERAGSTMNPFQYIGQTQYYRDVETGVFAVRRREMFPFFGRWTSVDPLQSDFGFPLFVYTRNSPTGSVDPSGELAINVRITSVKGNKSCASGAGGEADFRFSLDMGAPCDGYFIQRVEWICYEKACRCGCPPEGGPKYRTSTTYLEAFPLVKQGNTRPIYRDPKSGEVIVDKPTAFDDSALYAVPPGTCGTFLQYGEIRFYCKKDIGNEISNAKTKAGPTEWEFDRDFSALGKCAPGVMKDIPTYFRKDGKLPIWWTTLRPKATAFRTFGIDWDCCEGKGRVDIGATESHSDP